VPSISTGQQYSDQLIPLVRWCEEILDLECKYLYIMAF